MQLESSVLNTSSGIDTHQDNETMSKRRLRFLPGDLVLIAKGVRGVVLEIQPIQVHDVLVQWEDGLELWHNSNGLQRRQPQG